jgi:hypothetical protein
MCKSLFLFIFILIIVCFVAPISIFADTKCSRGLSGDVTCHELDDYGRETNRGQKCTRGLSGDVTCRDLNQYGY